MTKLLVNFTHKASWRWQKSKHFDVIWWVVHLATLLLCRYKNKKRLQKTKSSAQLREWCYCWIAALALRRYSGRTNSDLLALLSFAPSLLFGDDSSLLLTCWRLVWSPRAFCIIFCREFILATQPALEVEIPQVLRQIIVSSHYSSLFSLKNYGESHNRQPWAVPLN